MAFHWRDGWYFERVEDGAVAIYRRPAESNPSDGTTLVIPPAEWASIIASVSARGETGDTFLEAEAFHGLPLAQQ